MVVTQGISFITNILAGISGPNWLHWGTGVTAAALGNVNLETPRGEDRVDGVITQETIVSDDDTVQVIGTLYIEGVPADITEAGLFFADTGDTLFNRVVFAPISLGVDDGIQFTFRVRFANVSP